MKFLYLLSVIIMALPACKKHSQPQNNNPLAETAEPVIQFDSLPLKADRMWVYDNGDTMLVTSDTMVAGSMMKKIVVSNHSAKHILYCTSSAEGVYLWGTNGMPYTFIAPSGAAVNDTVTWFTTPIRLLKYPAYTGDSWPTNEPHMANSRRKWLAYASISNAAGMFDCIKLTGYNATEYYDAGKGLVRVVVQPECFTTPCPPFVTNLVYINF